MNRMLIFNELTFHESLKNILSDIRMRYQVPVFLQLFFVYLGENNSDGNRDQKNINSINRFN